MRCPAAPRPSRRRRSGASPAVAPQALRISDVRFEDKADRTEIRVRVDGRPEYALRSDGERTRILELGTP